MQSLRATATSLGLRFRPRLFRPAAPAEECPVGAQAEAAASDSSCSPGQDYTKYETLYLSCNKAVKGVLQLHKAQTLGELGFCIATKHDSFNVNLMSQTIMLEPMCKGGGSEHPGLQNPLQSRRALVSHQKSSVFSQLLLQAVPSLQCLHIELLMHNFLDFGLGSACSLPETLTILTLAMFSDLRQEGLAMDIAEAWKLDFINVHCIRKATYRGQNSNKNPDRIRLPFDALTFPGAIFLVTCLHSF